ncbi:hypothetical protein CCO03_06545 [Comamonas serinivorans]|uniref:Uncharacterized protein n=1 Tax=Comamonas serinivorans TaxID=1082851 RepID=A0A1Y0ELT9_9BURK|nr:hypothetical protein [Comamonas serinivorans]ARU04378.1 hypothetical protein CCO03_06545 [Comamonas serinivorans]
MKAILIAATCVLCVACSKSEDKPAEAKTPEAVQPAPQATAQPQQTPATPAANASPLTRSADGVTYENDYMGLSIAKPEGWYAQPAEETMKMSQRGTDMVAGDDKMLKAMLDASLKSSLPLFSFFEAPPGTPGKQIASLVGVAENISALPGIKSGCDYLSHVGQMLKSAAPQFSVSDTCKTERIQGNTFGVLEVTAKQAGILMTQHYYACRKGEHAVAMVGTSYDAAGATKLGQVLQTLKVKCG